MYKIKLIFLSSKDTRILLFLVEYYTWLAGWVLWHVNFYRLLNIKQSKRILSNIIYNETLQH